MHNKFDRFEIAQLAHRFKVGQLTDEEQLKFDAWYNSHQDGRVEIEDQGIDLEQIKKEMEDRIFSGLKAEKRRYKIMNKPFIQWVSYAAVVSLLLAGMVLVYLKINKEVKNNDLAIVKPGGNAAVLTLANGKKILLNDISNGDVADESGIHISQTHRGELLYTITEKKSGDPSTEYHTIETPNGGQYKVLLPDGTQIALNAASTLKYPSSFSKMKERKVELVGEAYFEVARDAGKPFIVKTKDQQVEVLGTRFNINCYDDEPSIKTTLLSGSVKVTAHSESAFKILKPGQQSVLNFKGFSVLPVDADTETSWRNGEFVFTGQSLEVIMRMISRWYNITVKYEFTPSDDLKFSGQVLRSRSLPAVLKMLEVSGEIKISLNGREVTINK